MNQLTVFQLLQLKPVAQKTVGCVKGAPKTHFIIYLDKWGKATLRHSGNEHSGLFTDPYRDVNQCSVPLFFKIIVFTVMCAFYSCRIKTIEAERQSLFLICKNMCVIALCSFESPNPQL